MSSPERSAGIPTNAPRASGAAPCACILLAGQRAAPRAGSLAAEMGVPVAALPLDARVTVVGAWLEALDAANFGGRRILALSTDEDGQFYKGTGLVSAGVAEGSVKAGSALELRTDTAQHRGVAGTVADICAPLMNSPAKLEHGVLVIECSCAPNFDIAGMLRAIPADASIVVGVSSGDIPAGVVWLSREAIERIPSVGFFDLKEQLVTAMVAAGTRVTAHVGCAAFNRIATRESYLAAIEQRLDEGGLATSPDAIIAPDAQVRGATMICRGVRVESGAFVSDAAILPGATIGARATVARSVVPPGAIVPAGALVVDQIYAPLEYAPRASVGSVDARTVKVNSGAGR